MILDYIKEKDEIFKLLENKGIMVLATSNKDRVTARSMSMILIDESLYFQTDSSFLKYNQIEANKNVALCIDNIQVEGIAYIKGHPMDAINVAFKNKFQKVHKNSYDAYSSISSEVVIEVKPTLITVWKYEDSIAYRIYLDLVNNTAIKKYYNKIN